MILMFDSNDCTSGTHKYAQNVITDIIIIIEYRAYNNIFSRKSCEYQHNLL